MNVALVDSQVFPGKEASCTYEIAVFKLRNQRKKKRGIEELYLRLMTEVKTQKHKNPDSVRCTQWSVGNVVQKHHNSECMVQGYTGRRLNDTLLKLVQDHFQPHWRQNFGQIFVSNSSIAGRGMLCMWLKQRQVSCRSVFITVTLDSFWHEQTKPQPHKSKFKL